jgi:hypothetical protein
MSSQPVPSPAPWPTGPRPPHLPGTTGHPRPARRRRPAQKLRSCGVPQERRHRRSSGSAGWPTSATRPTPAPRRARAHGGGYEVDAAAAVQRRAGDRARKAAGPESAPHPVDDAAWRYLHDLDDPRPGEGTPPFGLPVLAEIPGLATVLEQLREADRLIARALEGILLLQDHADVVAVTGVSLEAWVTTIARRTRADARMLLAAAEMVRRLPTLRAGFQEGRLSWAQVRAVALKARPLPRTLDDRVDQAIADALEGMGGAEPDAVTRVISWSLATLQPTSAERTERREQEREFLGMQPRLDGSGGRLWGEFGATSWAVIDAALNTPTGRATGSRHTPDDAADVDRRWVEGRGRAAQLVAALDRGLAGGAEDARGHGRPEAATDRDQAMASPRTSGSRPQLLLRADLDTLLDRAQTPGALLTSVLGGHVRVSASTARRLLEERGADLRTVILDQSGGVVGVGRRVRVAPGWLRDATLALHDTCSAPGCEAPARTSEIDHARPWRAARPDDLPGSTDVAELAPVCARHNQRKERDGWTVRQTSDGRRTWTHQRSGLITRTVPSTWQPRAGTPPALGPAPDE